MGSTVLIVTVRGVCDVLQTEGRGDEMGLRFRIKESRLTLLLSEPLCAQTPPEGMSYLRMSVSLEWVVLVKL
jgi:hypothetical protein